MHCLVFYSFIVLFVTTLIIMIEYDASHLGIQINIFHGFVYVLFSVASELAGILVLIGVADELLHDLHPAKNLKVRIEVDTDPPGNFETETRYVLRPVPFPVRTYTLPDLFAGKLHAILCRKWKTRVKGRDWYDLVWYVARHPQVRLAHLESRMRQSGDYTGDADLTPELLQGLLRRAVDGLDVEKVRREVAPFIRDQSALGVWSREFFAQVIARIVTT